ncbi:MAG: phosphate ABC transporter substrate-binding protein PstS [Pseudonocardiales bacterium]|nr:phosphate ABC transporter substrate-binding protein PstS [Pseudonocardiales bacterium]
MPSALAPSAGAAASFVPISGSGSTWSFNALEQWRKNVAGLYGMTINFSPNGSTNGRNDYRNGQVDFAVSEIPYGLTDGGVLDPPPQRGFAYMPIVAGGTAFMYNLKIGNKRVTNLRLSGETVTKIFTQKITTWDDPAIKADNPGLALPPRKIIPVVYSNGSGSAAQFTTWMANQYPALWDDYCHRNGRSLTPCGFTSFYPLGPGMEAKAQSQGVAGFVAQDSSEGAITFVEYSYARNAGFPVVKLLNKANYYVEPLEGSVAVALLKAKIAPDLTQDLTQVYVNLDPRTYPLSSYSYMILPRGPNPGSTFNDKKGATLSEFGAYFLCEGQQTADILGYSPLPINLVQAGVDQINQIPGSTKKLDRNNLAHCNNPTVSLDGGNRVAEEAPQPAPCDLKGAPQQCATGTGGARAATPTSSSGGAGGSVSGAAGAGGEAGGGGGVGGGGVGGTNNATGGAGGRSGTGTGVGGGSAPVIDPDTGQVINGSSVGSALSPSGASAVPVSVDAADNRRQILVAALTIAALLVLILGPPLLAYLVRRREGAVK